MFYFKSLKDFPSMDLAREANSPSMFFFMLVSKPPLITFLIVFLCCSFCFFASFFTNAFFTRCSDFCFTFFGNDDEPFDALKFPCTILFLLLFQFLVLFKIFFFILNFFIVQLDYFGIHVEISFF